MEIKKQQKVDINKRPGLYKLLCANYNKDGSKVGVHLLDYSAELENGHLDSPTIITTWLDVSEHKQALSLVSAPFMSNVACIVSGGGDFIKVHKILTKAEYDAILAMF